MTGYASLTRHLTPAPARDLAVEIRGVNSRFLDLILRLPEALRAQEPDLRALVATQLQRGKVELTLTLSQGAAPFALPPAAWLSQLAQQQEQVRNWLPNLVPLSMGEVLRLWQPLAAPESNGAAASLGAAALQTTREALEQFVQSREREGQRLGAVLQQCLEQLQSHVLRAQTLVPQQVAAQQKRFRERLPDAIAQLGLDPSLAESPALLERALAEVTALALRTDVAEELARLLAHIEEARQCLSGTAARSGSCGKRLDFLVQEMQREANTLSSKSASLELSRIAVEMKVLIEQLREQVQNLE